MVEMVWFGMFRVEILWFGLCSVGIGQLGLRCFYGFVASAPPQILQFRGLMNPFNL